MTDLGMSPAAFPRAAWNDTSADYNRDALVHELADPGLGARPGRTGTHRCRTTLRHGELTTRSAQVGALLHRLGCAAATGSACTPAAEAAGFTTTSRTGEYSRPEGQCRRDGGERLRHETGRHKLSHRGGDCPIVTGAYRGVVCTDGVVAADDWEQIGRAVGRPVAEAVRVRRGYSNNRRWLARLDDGRTVFAKRADDEPGAIWLRREHHVYRELHAPFMPAMLGWHDDGKLPVLVLEDLSGSSWPAPLDSGADPGGAGDIAAAGGAPGDRRPASRLVDRGVQRRAGRVAGTPLGSRSWSGPDRSCGAARRWRAVHQRPGGAAGPAGALRAGRLDRDRMAGPGPDRRGRAGPAAGGPGVGPGNCCGPSAPRRPARSWGTTAAGGSGWA